MSASLLSRVSQGVPGGHPEAASPTQAQSRVDGTVSYLKDQLADLSFIAGLCVGIAANRFVRMAGVARGKAFLHEADSLRKVAATQLGRPLPPGLVPARVYRMAGGASLALDANQFLYMSRITQGISYPLGMAAGSTAHEMTRRVFQSIRSDDAQTPHLLKWEGKGGIKRGLLQSLLTIGPALGANTAGAYLGDFLSTGLSSPARFLAIGTLGAFALFGTHAGLHHLNQRIGIVEP